MQELRLLSKTPVAGRSLQQTNRMMELLKLRDAASSSSSKRKRKKRRKKKLPRGRARRRQRQRPLSGALIVDSGRGMCRAGFPSSRCVPFGCRQAQMLGIMAGMGPEGFCCSCRTRTKRVPQFQFIDRVVDIPVFMSMDLADPVSSGKYSGIFVFTAPVAELTVMSFSVPVNGYTIVATATVSFSSSADCPVSAAPMCCWSVCVAMSCGGGVFTPDGAYDSVWDSARPMTGKYIINYFQYQEVVGCVCVLDDWISSNDEFFAPTITTTSGSC